jgi:hypothetical protein
VARLAAMLLGATSLVGCGSDQATLDWRVSFETEELAMTARMIELTVLSETCRGAEVHRWRIPRGTPPRVEAVLPRGRYAFRARASDTSCAWFAEECQVAALPRPEPIDQVLTAIAAVPACGVEMCVDGLCALPDAGTPDAGRLDAGPPDTGPADTGPVDTGPVDTGPVDTGPPPPPDAGGECESGMPCFSAMFGIGFCIDNSCCTGCVSFGGPPTCMSGLEQTACGAGGSPCFPCGDSATCVGGMCMTPGSGG